MVPDEKSTVISAFVLCVTCLLFLLFLRFSLFTGFEHFYVCLYFLCLEFTELLGFVGFQFSSDLEILQPLFLQYVLLLLWESQLRGCTGARSCPTAQRLFLGFFG